jgi:hypothetical protein
MMIIIIITKTDIRLINLSGIFLANEQNCSGVGDKHLVGDVYFLFFAIYNILNDELFIAATVAHAAHKRTASYLNHSVYYYNFVFL